MDTAEWTKLGLTGVVLVALVGLALVAAHIPALQTLYMQVSGSLLGLLGVHHGHDVLTKKIDDGEKTTPPPALDPVPSPVTLLTEDQLRQIMPRATPELISLHTPLIVAAAQEFDITTKPRLAMWLGNCALECDQLKELVEEWTDSPAQQHYEGNKALGNTEPGDGKRFLGRGVIQLTGRWNYGAASKALGDVDLVEDPPKAAEPDIAWRTAGWYWQSHKCNILADADNFQGTVLKINGGLTDLESREVFYNRAVKALS